MPTFSIITVVYNGAALLPGTVESVRRQTFDDYEYIVVDGASKDQSLQIIQDYAAQMPQMRYLSEPDRGLYDAMNKGLRMATGDFVQFLNCGDHLHAPDTLARMAACIGSHTDVLYGETLLVDEARQPAGTMSDLSTRRLPQHLTWRSFLGGMLVVHQSFVPRRALAPAYRVDNLCADYDWCIRILRQSRQAVHVGLVVTDYLMGGLSKQRHRQSLRDRFEVMRSHYGLPLTLLAHAWIVLRAAAHRLLRWGKKRY
ncbi:MAG TPA: glycosyltransferase family 2 protein [Saprospiraceae bacterium]|nr:glycosyltransferase family 2 protein [Saprospiraceae bacterium]